MQRKLFVLFLLTVLVSFSAANAAPKPKPNINPADYTINVHVRVSEFGPLEGTSLEQALDVTIGGKHYRLSAQAMTADVHGIGALRFGLLPVGDYKARRMPLPSRTPAYLVFDEYELLLPDGRTLRCSVSGLYEEQMH
jgi:hypothetical protein